MGTCKIKLKQEKRKTLLIFYQLLVHLQIYLSVQNVSDQLLVALQAANLRPVCLNKVVQVEVQLWPPMHDVSDDCGQRTPLLSSCCMLIGLVVTV